MPAAGIFAAGQVGLRDACSTRSDSRSCVAILSPMEANEVRVALEAGWPELASMLVEHDADPVTGGLSYLEMSAVTRFLAEKLRAGDTVKFGPFFEAVEVCLHEGSDEAVTLVMVGLLEDLQNSNITDMEMGVWVPFLGPTTRRAWKAVEDFWNGDVDAIARFSVQA